MQTPTFAQHLLAMIAAREVVIMQRERANAEDREFIARAKDRLVELERTQFRAAAAAEDEDEDGA